MELLPRHVNDLHARAHAGTRRQRVSTPTGREKGPTNRVQVVSFGSQALSSCQGSQHNAATHTRSGEGRGSRQPTLHSSCIRHRTPEARPLHACQTSQRSERSTASPSPLSTAAARVQAAAGRQARALLGVQATSVSCQKVRMGTRQLPHLLRLDVINFSSHPVTHTPTCQVADSSVSLVVTAAGAAAALRPATHCRMASCLPGAFVSPR